VADVVNGFTPRAFAFFRELAANNTREFWLAHKAEFEAVVREPMESLLAALPEPYDGFRPFRMNRDVRFSKDKSPYKTAHAAVLDDRGAVLYLQVSAEGMFAAGGGYLLAPDQLERFRAAVDAPAPGLELERIIDELGREGIEVGPGGAEPLKTAPRGFDKDHPRIGLLRQKGIAAGIRLGPEDCRNGDELLATVVDFFDAVQPLTSWLRDHVGPSTAPRGR